MLPGLKAWESQYRLFYWTVDAAIPGRRLVVQADGDYWHGLTAAKTGEVPHPTVALTISKDRAQDKYLEKAGWRILRLWESELIKNPDWCLRRIMAAMEEPSGESGMTSA
ncbi:endonuclease domain-containing protein (plasmid) [Streptomyces sp. NBC_01166]|uniref:endonuclease domain-containing protein n=1 Tax=Streptomyces sp. NBC_01166 TaxID=2903755 RepID=UPI002F9085CB|nr:endonuclease domain-containing protein [Streptomyces sp. NBC_01166]